MDDLKPITTLLILTGRYYSPNTRVKSFETLSHCPTSFIFGIVALTAIILGLLILIILLITAYKVAPLS